jgi:hypothetical protein
VAEGQVRGAEQPANSRSANVSPIRSMEAGVMTEVYNHGCRRNRERIPP